MFDISSIFVLGIFTSLSITFFIVIVLFWKKLFRPGLVNLVCRIFLLALCQLLIVSTVGITINRSNGFYSSWSDLFGISTNYAKDAKTASFVKIPDSTLIRSSQVAAAGQRIIKDIVHGENSGISNVVYIILPKNVADSLALNQPIDMSKTKIVELLVGYPSIPENWLRSLNITKALARAETDNPGNSIIGVIPAVNVAGSTDLECMNFPDGGVQAETWLTSDLHAYVNKRLGIPPIRWGLMGVSTGGWCAAMLSLKHEDMYYGAVSIAGYYRPLLDSGTRKSVKAQLEASYAFPKLENQMTSTTNMLLITSAKDYFSYAETKLFREQQQKNINYQYIELAEGGHNARVWISQLGVALQWLHNHYLP
jgi:predicted esterase